MLGSKIQLKLGRRSACFCDRFLKPPGPFETLILKLSPARGAIFHFFAEAVFHTILASFWTPFSMKNASKNQSKKQYKKSVQNESNKHPKRLQNDSKIAPETLPKTSPKKNTKKREKGPKKKIRQAPVPSDIAPFPPDNPPK